MYIGSGPTYGEYGFAFTVTAHFNDGITLTTEPLVDIFALSDPNYGDFADTASLSQQDQASFAIYRAIMRGDFNRDGLKSSARHCLDVAVLTNPSGFQTAHGLANSEFLAIADVNQDGQITNADLQSLLLLLKSGGQSANTVPEPSGLALMASALGVFIWRRWRE